MPVTPTPPAPADISILAGLSCDEDGKIVDQEGHIVGEIFEGDVEAASGRKCDAFGIIRGLKKGKKNWCDYSSSSHHGYNSDTGPRTRPKQGKDEHL